MKKETDFRLCLLKEDDKVCLFEMKREDAFCWLFNIGIEEEWTKGRFSVKNVEEQRAIQHMEESLLLLAKRQDIVILRRMPETDFLYELEEIGFELPHILCPMGIDYFKTITELVLEDESLLSILRDLSKGKVYYLVPYGVTKREEKLSELTGMKIKGSKSEIVRKTNSKLYARRLAEELGMACPKGIVCHSIGEIKDAWTRLQREFSKVIVKQLYGASGQGLFLVDNGVKLKRILYALNRFATKNDRWIVEGWYEDKVDLNAQLFLHDNGGVEVLSIKRQILNNTVYRGSMFPVSISEENLEHYQNKLLIVGNALYEEGVRGVVGMDSIITNNVIYPIIEINVRFTLSTYLGFLPRIFEKCFFQSMYYRIFIHDSFDWRNLLEQTKKRGIYFDKNEKRGVFFYNYACMNSKCVSGIGRLFVIAVAKQKYVVQILIQEMEKLIVEVFGKHEIGGDSKTEDSGSIGK